MIVFTLIELAVVAGILTILGGVVYKTGCSFIGRRKKPEKPEQQKPKKLDTGGSNPLSKPAENVGNVTPYQKSETFQDFTNRSKVLASPSSAMRV